MSHLAEYVDKIEVVYLCKTGDKYQSTVDSLDVNDHIQELSKRLSLLPKEARDGGEFDVYYRGKRMFIGDGPRYTVKSLATIVSLGAELGQDIYCMCNAPDKETPQCLTSQ